MATREDLDRLGIEYEWVPACTCGCTDFGYEAIISSQRIELED